MTQQEKEQLIKHYHDYGIPKSCQWELHEPLLLKSYQEAAQQNEPLTKFLNEVDRDFVDRPEILARQVVSEAVAQECRQELAEAQKNGWKI